MFYSNPLILSAFIVLTSSSSLPMSCDTSRCISVPKHYSELNCEPFYEDDQSCCPSHFSCPNFQELNQSKCHYKGETFERGYTLEEYKIVGLCSAVCVCDLHDIPAGFHCANVECPEFTRQPDPKCVVQRSMNHCCSIRTICDSDAIDELATCQFDGKTYREGEAIFPQSHSCYKCICGRNFDNSTVVRNPHCREIECGFQLRYLNQIQKECIPIYFRTDRCCPIGWRCPREDDCIIENEHLPNQVNRVCKFGNLTLNFGDSLSSTIQNNRCEECKCLIPPMVHCIQRPTC